MTESSKFNELAALDVSKYVEKKNGLSYLSWAHAWRIFKEHCPDAQYNISTNNDGLPYFLDDIGAMVYTSVSAGGESYKMWLCVMDGANNPLKTAPYTYTVYDKWKKQDVTKKVDAINIFDVNKAIMRCLVKNLAMFGLGLNLYAGEDIPFESTIPVVEEVKTKPLKELIPAVSEPRELTVGEVYNANLDVDRLYLQVKHLIKPDFIPRVNEVLKLNKEVHKEARDKLATYFQGLLNKG